MAFPFHCGHCTWNSASLWQPMTHAALVMCVLVPSRTESIFAVNHAKAEPWVVWAWLGSDSRPWTSLSGLGKGLWLPRKRMQLTVQKSMVGEGKPSGFFIVIQGLWWAFLHMSHPLFCVLLPLTLLLYIGFVIAVSSKLFLSQAVISVFCALY